MNAIPRRSARLAARALGTAPAQAPVLPSPPAPPPRVKTHTEPITWTQDEMNEFGKVYYNYFREMNMYDDMEKQLIEYKRLGKVKFESRPCMKGFRLYRGYY